MANYKARRHYRVAEKEMAQAPSKGTFVPDDKKNKLIALFVAVVLLTYFKGLFLGYLFGKKA